MELRVLNVEDAEQYQQVRLRALREHPEAFLSSPEEEELTPPEQLASRVTPSAQRFIVGAFDAGRLVGMAGFYQMAPIKARHKGHVWGMYVAPEARGHGLGWVMLVEIIRRGRELPVLEEIVLAVTVGNEAARHIYIACGFVAYGIEPRLIRTGGRDYDIEWMILRL